MKHEAAIARLCKLTCRVMAMKFDYKYPADCLCIERMSHHESTSEEVISFIEKAVMEKLTSASNPKIELAKEVLQQIADGRTLLPRILARLTVEELAKE